VRYFNDAVDSVADELSNVCEEFGIETAQDANGLVDVVIDLVELVLTDEVASSLRHQGHRERSQRRA
jgi:hypothetical protein